MHFFSIIDVIIHMHLSLLTILMNMIFFHAIDSALF